MWHDGIVYHRNFAYNSRRYRYRRASGSIGNVPAATFAEYVDDPFFNHRHDEGRRITDVE